MLFACPWYNVTNIFIVESQEIISNGWPGLISIHLEVSLLHSLKYVSDADISSLFHKHMKCTFIPSMTIICIGNKLVCILNYNTKFLHPVLSRVL